MRQLSNRMQNSAPGVPLADLPASIERTAADDQRGRTLLGEITLRKQAEDQLRKLSQAVEQSPSVVMITDKAGCIEYVNPKFCQVTGYTPEEVNGQNPRLLKSGDLSPAEYRRLWATIQAGKEWRGEFRNKRKNGEK